MQRVLFPKVRWHFNACIGPDKWRYDWHCSWVGLTTFYRNIFLFYAKYFSLNSLGVRASYSNMILWCTRNIYTWCTGIIESIKFSIEMKRSYICNINIISHWHNFESCQMWNLLRVCPHLGRCEGKSTYRSRRYCGKRVVKGFLRQNGDPMYFEGGKRRANIKYGK